MLDPLSQLVAALNVTGAPPADWAARHAPAGDLRAAWAQCETPRAMHKVLFMVGRDDDAARAQQASADALRDARARGLDVAATRRAVCDAIRAAVPEPPTLHELVRAWQP